MLWYRPRRSPWRCSAPGPGSACRGAAFHSRDLVADRSGRGFARLGRNAMGESNAMTDPGPAVPWRGLVRADQRPPGAPAPLLDRGDGRPGARRAAHQLVLTSRRNRPSYDLDTIRNSASRWYCMRRMVRPMLPRRCPARCDPTRLSAGRDWRPTYSACGSLPGSPRPVPT
jgi:hypothetical protein